MKTKKQINLKLLICVFILFLSSCSRSIDGIQTFRDRKNNLSENNKSKVGSSVTENQKKETQFDSVLKTENKLNDEKITASSELILSEIKRDVNPPTTNKYYENFEMDWSANNL